MTERGGNERIALFGGTFDPFHRGHVEPVRAVFDTFGWSRVIYIPAWVQPFKTGQVTSSAYHRHAMTVLGTIDDPRLEVSIEELERESISYTVDTLRQFRQRHPDAGLDWIIGDDNLSDLHKWKSVDEILSLANFVVLARRGGEQRLEPDLRRRVSGVEEAGSAGSILFADNEALAISSTELRARLRGGDLAGDLLQPAVAAYVERNRLYRATNDE